MTGGGRGFQRGRGTRWAIRRTATKGKGVLNIITVKVRSQVVVRTRVRGKSAKAQKLLEERNSG